MTGLLGIMIVVLGVFAGKDASDEVGSLSRSAKALLDDGHARKALVLLRRARALDPRQAEVDQLMDACRASLGMWVSPEASARSIVLDDRLQQAVRERPDSMVGVAKGLVVAEDLGEAVRVWSALASHHGASPAILEGFRDARARQEMKVAFHLDLSRRSVSRGQLGQALLQARLAWSARPEDPLLREKVDQTRLAFEQGIAALDRDLRDRLASGDLDGARATVRWIRIAAPELDSFRRIQDSLANRKREVLLARLREVDAMVDAGREREAIEAVLDLGDSDPQDPLVVSTREALGRRLEGLRRRRNLDGIARSVEEAIRSADGSRAVALFEDLQRAGRGDTAEQRLRPRVDSIRQAERSAAVFDEGLTAARQALARKDLVSGRAALQRALAARPGNVMARKLLSDVEAAPPPVPIVERRVAPDNRVGERVRELLVSGVAAYRAGEYESALARWHQALELDPDNVQARRYIDNVGKKQERLR